MLSAQQFKKCRYHLNKPIGYISLVYTWRDTKLAKFSMIKVLQQHKNYENNSKRETCCITLLDFYLVRADAELRVSQFGYSIDLCGPCLFLLLYNLLFSTIKNQTDICILLGKKTKCQNGTRRHKIPDRI